MSFGKLVLASLVHHWRVNVAVALGVAAGAAVLSGALFVGDSVKGSLRDLALDRLGDVDYVLVAPQFFRGELAEELESVPGFDDSFRDAQQAIALSATLLNAKTRQAAGDVELMGIEDDFWSLGSGGPSEPNITGRKAILNEQTAAALDVQVGDDVIVNLPLLSRVNTESNFGRKDAQFSTLRLKVVEIIPTRGVGRFGLRPNQQLPKNAFVPLATVQAALDMRGQINALLVAGKSNGDSRAEVQAKHAMETLEQFSPKLEDYGLSLTESERGYTQLTSDALTLSQTVTVAAQQAFANQITQPAFTYLANDLKVEQDGITASIPYSTVTAIDFVQEKPLGPWQADNGNEVTALTNTGDASLRPVALNQWSFDDLNRQLKEHGAEALAIGDRITMTYFEPEYEAGKSVESSVEFRLAAVVSLSEICAARDAELTPEVPGVTDQETIDSWDPPFEFDRTKIRDDNDGDNADQDYWDEFRTTPKAFFSLDAGQEMWSSRFGRLTAIRIAPQNGTSLQQLAESLRAELDPREMGFVWQPVKQNALQAASGTTPFALLFLGLSFVLIAAAAMLVLLLFRLGVETRASQVGLLLAVGMRRRQVRLVLAAEGLVVSLLGSAVGTALGIGYAGIMTYGLRTWWVGAVKTPFLRLHVTWPSVAIGFVSGTVVAMLAIWWATRQMRKFSVRSLLSGTAAEPPGVDARRLSWPGLFAAAMLILALVLAWLATTLIGEAQTGAFMGSGFCVLAGAVALVRAQLRSGGAGAFVHAGKAASLALALRNAARNPGRSTLTISLVATALFLITSVSAFWLDLSRQAAEINGGFDLVAQSAVSLNYRFDNSDVYTEQYAFQQSEADVVADTRIVSFATLPGEDASCNNLYQTVRPRVLAVPAELDTGGDFLWAGSEAETPEEKENPWLLLERTMPSADDGTPTVPVILDANTAQYSLGLQVGKTMPFVDDYNHKVTLHVVALLKNSIFQGDILMGQSAFKNQFPYVSGSRFFLIDVGEDSGKAADVSRTLSAGLEDYGLAVQTTTDRLQGFLAVQNTYISTFLTLGGLGLLLGTFGVATVQIRNVVERRAELAVLRATGFRRAKLVRLVLTENVFLLLAGLVLGAVCGLVSIFPQIFVGAAAIPWGLLGITFVAVLGVGLLAASFAALSTLRAPLLPALRGD
ncbi:MAG: FtsX-like permease family protein [Pirellulales bacterium]|nr:FtsX-like permease family protein [Pirellulales bacterium]